MKFLKIALPKKIWALHLGHMRLEDAFYLLVVDEVRVLPGFIAKLERISSAQRLLMTLGKYSATLGPAGDPDFLYLGPGIGQKIAHELGQFPLGLIDEYQRKLKTTSDESIYMTRVESAILNLLWKNCFQAEELINQAKYIYDHWSFAHYIYGLLLGLRGDAGKAHFELYLALHREPYPEAKKRIERALKLVR